MLRIARPCNVKITSPRSSEYVPCSLHGRNKNHWKRSLIYYAWNRKCGVMLVCGNVRPKNLGLLLLGNVGLYFSALFNLFYHSICVYFRCLEVQLPWPFILFLFSFAFNVTMASEQWLFFHQLCKNEMKIL